MGTCYKPNVRKEHMSLRNINLADIFIFLGGNWTRESSYWILEITRFALTLVSPSYLILCKSGGNSGLLVVTVIITHRMEASPTGEESCLLTYVVVLRQNM